MIYETIRNVAKKQNVSIRKIEQDLGFSNGTIHYWNNSDSLPKSKIKAVAEYLHVDPYTLLLIGVDINTIKED